MFNWLLSNIFSLCKLLFAEACIIMLQHVFPWVESESESESESNKAYLGQAIQFKV